MVLALMQRFEWQYLPVTRLGALVLFLALQHGDPELSVVTPLG